MQQTEDRQPGEPVAAPAVAPGPAAGPAAEGPSGPEAAVERQGGWWSRDWLLAGLLVIAAMVAYQPAWHGQRVWDDDAHLTRPSLRSLEGLGRIWTQVGATQQYYPLTFTAFWVQHKLWGDAALGYHLVNILLHSLSALLFLILLRQLGVPGAWLAAAIFALHPVQVESVAWMSQLKNTLSGVFYLGAALAYLGFDRSRRTRSYVLAWGLFVLGLLSKTAIVTLPAGLLVVFWWKRGRLLWKRDVLPLLPFFVTGLVAGLVTVSLERSLYGAEGREFQLSGLERCLVAGRAIWFHLGKLLWPAHLLFMYPRWQIRQAVWQQYLYPAAVLLLLAGLWGLRHWRRGPLAGLLLFIGTLFPALGFFDAYTFRYSFVNDHHQYLASLGIIALVSAGISKVRSAKSPLPRPSPHRMGRGASLLRATLAGALLAALGVLTWRQSRMYVDTETLWRTTLTGNPACYLACANLGSLRFRQGRMDEAIAYDRRALEARPDYAEGHNDLGLALMQKGQVDEAIAHFEKALDARPGFTEAHVNLGNALMEKGQMGEAIAQYQKALATQPRNEQIYSNLGNALFRAGKLDAAIQCLQQALEILPTFADAHNNLGTILLQQGQADEAIAELSQWLRTNPNDPAAHCQLAGLLSAQGRTKESIQHYRAALKAAPDSPEALNNLAWILAANTDPETRNGAEAVALAERACQLTEHTQALMVGTLAAAYAEAGGFAEAVATAEKAAVLAGQAGQPELAMRNRKLIELYRAGKPARDTH